MDLDDSFTRELEESSHIEYDDKGDILELDLDVKKEDGDEQQGQQPTNRFVSSVADAEAREAALRAELESIKRVNKLISTVTKSIETATGNMSVREPLFYLELRYVILLTHEFNRLSTPPSIMPTSSWISIHRYYRSLRIVLA
jgi:hypothetical protein